ncbi:MAG: hypothetical protein OXU69_00010 [Gemmatimonadota bacterium]|nr:hypothetical protein [Gemmatimonadota bacterium]
MSPLADYMWRADITHSLVAQGFLWLADVLDWATRQMPAWPRTNTLDATFRVEALDDTPGCRVPEFLNTDKGTRFTGAACADRVPEEGLPFPMDGRRSFHNNIFVKRLWRSLKYGAAYPWEADNKAPPHSPLGPETCGDASCNGMAGVWTTDRRDCHRTCPRARGAAHQRGGPLAGDSRRG